MGKIYIADLNAYNNGRLKGEWIALPVDKEDLDDIIARHTNNGQTDFAIHDYELPFQISEYESPYHLNELFTWLDENNIDIESIEDNLRNYKLEEALTDIKNIAYEIENDLNTSEAVEYANEYIDYEEAEEMAKSILSEEGGLARMPFFIGDCNFMTASVFRINGYGNLETVRKDTLTELLNDVIKIAYDSFKQ